MGRNNRSRAKDKRRQIVSDDEENDEDEGLAVDRSHLKSVRKKTKKIDIPKGRKRTSQILHESDIDRETDGGEQEEVEVIEVPQSKRSSRKRRNEFEDDDDLPRKKRAKNRPSPISTIRSDASEFDEFDLSGRKGAHIEDEEEEEDSSDGDSSPSVIIEFDSSQSPEKTAPKEVRTRHLEWQAEDDANNNMANETELTSSDDLKYMLARRGVGFIDLTMRVHEVRERLTVSGVHMIKVVLHNRLRPRGGVLVEMLEWRSNQIGGLECSPLNCLEINEVYNFYNVRVQPIKPAFARFNRGTIKDPRRAWSLAFYPNRSSFAPNDCPIDEADEYDTDDSFIDKGGDGGEEEEGADSGSISEHEFMENGDYFEQLDKKLRVYRPEEESSGDESALDCRVTSGDLTETSSRSRSPSTERNPQKEKQFQRALDEEARRALKDPTNQPISYSCNTIKGAYNRQKHRPKHKLESTSEESSDDELDSATKKRQRKKKRKKDKEEDEEEKVVLSDDFIVYTSSSDDEEEKDEDGGMMVFREKKKNRRQQQKRSGSESGYENESEEDDDSDSEDESNCDPEWRPLEEPRRNKEDKKKSYRSNNHRRRRKSPQSESDSPGEEEEESSAEDSGQRSESLSSGDDEEELAPVDDDASDDGSGGRESEDEEEDEDFERPTSSAKAAAAAKKKNTTGKLTKPEKKKKKKQGSRAQIRSSSEDEDEPGNQDDDKEKENDGAEKEKRRTSKAKKKTHRYNLRPREDDDGIRWPLDRSLPPTDEREFLRGGWLQQLHDESQGQYIDCMHDKERKKFLGKIGRRKFIAEEYHHRSYFWQASRL